MRVAILTIGLALTACSNQPKASDAELAEFDPPTVGVRGDVVPRQQARFARLDKNADGFITAGEFPKRNPERISGFDTNGDGKVSRGELVEGALRRFDARDTDKDGQVTPQERDLAANTQ